MEKLNKHGLPIINASVLIRKKVADNSYFCKGLDKKCMGMAVHKYGDYSYCDVCYLELIGYGNHAFE